MEILTIIQSTWVIFIVAMLFLRFRVGVAAYLAYIFLVPYMNIEIGGFVLKWNFINILLLIAFFIDRLKINNVEFKLDWRPLSPFIIYFGVSLLLIPIQNDMPFSVAFNTWRIHLMKYLILPFVIWNDIIVNENTLKLYRNVIIGCIIIAAIYGLYLTTMPGINPYMISISLANGNEFNYAYAAGNSGLSNNTTLNAGRTFGRISSVFAHPMTFGLFLGFTLFYLYRNKENIRNWLLYGLILIILTDIVVCGVRSVIVATIIAVMVLFLQLRNFKLFISTAICVCLLLSVLIFYVPSLYDYLFSISDQTNSTVRGSSLEMRLSQLEGCFKEIQNTLFEGKGYGWTGYYLSQHEDGHPTILHFESLIFVILCNWGITGVILWLAMGIKIVKYNNRNKRPIAALLNSLFVFYIAYACITGEYGYMQYFIIFYILMLGEDIYLKKGRYIRQRRPSITF